MKKYVFAIFFSVISLASINIMDELKKIDQLLIQNKYSLALNNVNDLLKQDISNDDRVTLEIIRAEISNKMDGNTIKNADITNTDITRYESTIELASKNLDSVQNIYLVATCYRLLGEYDKSIKYYKKLIDIAPNSKAYFGIAMAYRLKGDKNMAIKYLDYISDAPDYIIRAKGQLLQELSY